MGPTQDPWPRELTDRLVAALSACPKMADPKFRLRLLRVIGKKLGLNRSFQVSYSSGATDHIVDIVDAFEEYREPAAAVWALWEAMEELAPGSGALRLLEDCARLISPFSVLGVHRLRAVLDAIDGLPLQPGRAQVQGLARRVIPPEESLLLLGTEDLPEVVRRLDRIPSNGLDVPPLVVRFLAALVELLDSRGINASQLGAELSRVTADLGLRSDQLRSAAAIGRSKPDRKVLEIQVEESAPGTYRIGCKAFDIRADLRQPAGCWPAPADIPYTDADQAWRIFLRQLEDLSHEVGAESNVTVEFVLPWSLLGHRVERWSLDCDNEDDWIGLRFPVVVCSFDRRSMKWSRGPWRERSEYLNGNKHGLLCDHMGWLSQSDSNVPQKALDAGRVIHMNGRQYLTSWLAKDENSATAIIGLTYAYDPDDYTGRAGLKDAFRAGIPVLLWRRDDGSADEFYGLLANVTIHELPSKLRKWRNEDPDADADLRNQIVLLWDDPRVDEPVDKPPAPLWSAPQPL